MDPAKVKGITDWPPPTSVKQMRTFLGFCNFYHRFIFQYAHLAKPLTELLQKMQTWDWTPEHDEAFEALKKRFTDFPILVIPDQNKAFLIEADASKFATGAVLSQDDMNGIKHPCAFLSQTLGPAERNYQIYDREFLSIMRALRTWRHYIQGSQFPTVVLSDHQNLTYFRKAQKLNPRQARWFAELADYDILLKYVPGTKMVAADALSRHPDHSIGIEDDNADIIALPDNLFISLVDLDLQHTTSDGYDIDEYAKNILLNADDHPGWSSIVSDNMTTLFFKGRQYIPANLDLRRQILRIKHDSPTADHPGILETYVSVSKDYYWPGLRSFVHNYVNGCPECQQFKINRRPAKPALMPVPAAASQRLFAHTSMDFLTDLPPADTGHDSILVLVDHSLSKGVILIPCKKKISALSTTDLILDNLYKCFGLPDKLISDHDPRFASQVFQGLLKALGITSSMSTAFHPQSDGTTERYNQEIETYLSIYCLSNPMNWPASLATLEFIHNSRRHTNRAQSPFELMFGYAPPALPTSFEDTNIPELDERLQLLSRIRREALTAHEIARQRMLHHIKSDFQPFTQGQKVWLENQNLKTMYNKKITPKREGPFPIKEVLGPITYRLALPRHWKIHDSFHACLLSPYKQNEVHGPMHPKPPPDLIDGEEEYEVDHIKKHRKFRGRSLRYLVHWKGYDDSQDTWEPKKNLDRSSDILQEYKRLHDLA